MQHLPFLLWERLQSQPVWSPAPLGYDSDRLGVGRFDAERLSSTSTPSRGNALSLEGEDGRAALRWRGTILRLSDHFTATAAAHPELAPVLLEALGNALEQLLLFGRERDLTLLEAWLDEELS